jgi:hypothetical protein
MSALLVAAAACFPVVQDMTSRYPVDPALYQAWEDSDEFLVLPLWYDDGACNLRSPEVLSALEIHDLSEHLDSRHRLGIVDTQGHGPSHFRSITAILLVGSDGRSVLLDTARYPKPDSPDVYWRPIARAQLDSPERGRLLAWIRGSPHPPQLFETEDFQTTCDSWDSRISSRELDIAEEFVSRIRLDDQTDELIRDQGI